MDHRRVKEIQRAYVSVVKDHYADERARYASSGLSLDDFLAGPWSNAPSILVPGARGGITTQTECKALALRDEVRTFWLRHHSEILDAIHGEAGLATAVWGDSDNPDVARRYAIYFDSTFVPDPLPYHANPETRGLQHLDYAEDYFKWTLIVEALAPLACCDEMDCPIIFVPQLFSTDGGVEPATTAERVAELKERAHLFTYHYMSEVLGLESPDLSPHNLLTKALGIGLEETRGRIAASDTPAFLGPFLGRRQSYPSIDTADYADLAGRVTRGSVDVHDLARLFGLIGTHFYVLESRAENAALLSADASLSDVMWSAAVRKNELIEKRFHAKSRASEQDVVAASFQTHFRWLDNLMDDEIMQIRANGGLKEIRRLIAIDQTELRTATPQDFDRTIREYQAAVTSRLEAFSSQLEAAAEALRRRSALSKLSFGASAALGAASFALPTAAALSVLSALYGTVVGAPSVIDLVRERMNEKRETDRRRAVTLLVDAYARTHPQRTITPRQS